MTVGESVETKRKKEKKMKPGEMIHSKPSVAGVVGWLH
jgi:hypothetical protein